VIQRIERLNYILGGALVVAGAITQPRAVAFGVAVGVALTCLNFFVLRNLVVRITRDARTGTRSRAPHFMLPKMIVLMALVALAIFVLKVDPIAFAVGYSIFIVSILVAALESAIRQPTTENRDG
jgi:hypothetical protein